MMENKHDGTEENAVLSQASKWLNKVVEWSTMLGAICLLALTILTALDALMRYWLNMPIEWGYDISSYLMGALVFFGVAYTETCDFHVGVNVVVNLLSEERKIFVKLIQRIVMLGICIILAWAIWVRALSSFQTGSAMIGTVRIPKYPVEGIMCLGMVLFCAVLIVQIFDYVKEIRMKHSGEGPYL